jgi:hypothetical protein
MLPLRDPDLSSFSRLIRFAPLDSDDEPLIAKHKVVNVETDKLAPSHSTRESQADECPGAYAKKKSRQVDHHYSDVLGENRLDVCLLRPFFSANSSPDKLHLGVRCRQLVASRPVRFGDLPSCQAPPLCSIKDVMTLHSGRGNRS